MTMVPMPQSTASSRDQREREARRLQEQITQCVALGGSTTHSPATVKLFKHTGGPRFGGVGTNQMGAPQKYEAMFSEDAFAAELARATTELLRKVHVEWREDEDAVGGLRAENALWRGRSCLVEGREDGADDDL